MVEASIVITTRNRCSDLKRAVESSVAQVGVDTEVLVYDDASDDESADEIGTLYPAARVIRHETRKGLIVRRNEGIREARSNFVFFIDDDAYFTSSSTVSQTIELFREFPRVAAVALPFVEPSMPGPKSATSQHAPGTRLRSYVGCAHALRRDAALAAGGYREFLVHQGEERDLCIRLLNSGWGIIYGNTAPVVHTRSQIREHDRVDYFGYRNTLLFTALNVPLPAAMIRLVMDSVQLLLYRPANRRPQNRLRNVISGWIACLRHVNDRCPVSRRTYHDYRHLPRHEPLAPSELRGCPRSLCDRGSEA